MFHPVLLCLCLWRLTGVFGVEVKTSVSVMEGNSVTLDSALTELQKHDEIYWRFGDSEKIAEINKDDERFSTSDDALGGKFKGRLILVKQTGSLTITNTRTTDSGNYRAIISHFSGLIRLVFNVTVYARLPVPVISRDSSKCSSSSSSSSSSSCSLVCSSVVNVSHVTLSWYKGNSLLSSISASGLSLPLEVEYQDKNTYICVLNNPISNQTQHLDITQLCHTCSDSVRDCDSVEAVIRLVVTVLVGVAAAAAVVVLAYDIRSRRAELDQAHIHTSET